MASVGGIDLGTVISEKQTKTASLFQQPLPMQDSNQSILLDIFGMGRTIQITGVYVGTLEEQNTFIQAIEGIASGNQTGSTFVSSQTSTPNKNVFINDFEWTVNKADVSKIEYSLTLVEGATIS